MDHNIYWDDLNEAAQAHLIESGFCPEDRNVDIVPIATVWIPDDYDD